MVAFWVLPELEACYVGGFGIIYNCDRMQGSKLHQYRQRHHYGLFGYNIVCIKNYDIVNHFLAPLNIQTKTNPTKHPPSIHRTLKPL